MEIFKMKTSKYLVKCLKCYALAKIKLNEDCLGFIGECSNGHSFPYSKFNRNSNNIIIRYQTYKTKETQLNKKCYNCDKIIEKYNFDLKYDFIHNNSLINLCEDCIKNIPFVNNKSELKLKINDLKKKIEILCNKLKVLEDGIHKRFKQIYVFLYNFEFINSTLLNKFNYTIYDEYNYENFNYFFDLLNNEDFFNEEKYKNYIFFETKLNLGCRKDNLTLNIKINDKIKKDIIEYIPLEDYSFEYFKENKYYSYKGGKLKIFDYKNKIFQCVCIYNLNDSDIYDCLSKTDYNHFILYNEYICGQLLILQYSDDTNKITFKEKIEYNTAFIKIRNIIENKNGNLIINSNDNILLMSKINNNYEYYTINIDHHKNSLIYNINDSFFLTYTDLHINIYNTTDYSIVQKFFIFTEYIYQNKQKQILFLIDERAFNIYLINTKYFEIIQKFNHISTSYSFFISNELDFFEIIFENEKIIVKKYLTEEGCFYNYRVIEGKANYKISLNSNFLFLTKDNDMEILLLNN